MAEPKITTEEEWWQEVCRIREEFASKTAPRSTSQWSQMWCYECRRFPQAGEVIGWNMFGWTYHSGCSPKIVIPAKPQKK